MRIEGIKSDPGSNALLFGPVGITVDNDWKPRVSYPVYGTCGRHTHSFDCARQFQLDVHSNDLSPRRTASEPNLVLPRIASGRLNLHTVLGNAAAAVKAAADTEWPSDTVEPLGLECQRAC
jgi:hypothetical protein